MSDLFTNEELRDKIPPPHLDISADPALVERADLARQLLEAREVLKWACRPAVGTVSLQDFQGMLRTKAKACIDA